MTVVYHLCGYDKATKRLAVEQPVPARVLSVVRSLIEPVPNDPDLILPYELTEGAVRALAKDLGLTIDPTECHYYFEASDMSDFEVERETAATAR